MATAPSLLVILGPTASGKSALSIRLARQSGARILSVDSMQVYQGMSIGTAKPTLAEQHEIRHELIDWCRPDEAFSVARFVELADQVIRDSSSSQMPLIATGGTPLYFKSLFYGLFDGPGADPGIRLRLQSLSEAELHQRLQEVDPPASVRIHPADRRRAIRALEVAELTGKTISSLQTAWEANAAPRYQAVWVGLAWDKEVLNRRINARVRDMVAAGWVDEVRDLLRNYPEISRTASQATGYAQLIAHVEGKISLNDAIEQIKMATRQLARKQMKWFKRFPGVTWIDGALPIEEQAGRVWQLWMGGA